MSDLQSPSWFATTPLAEMLARGRSAPSLSIARVLARSLDVCRRQWLALTIFTFGVGYAPSLLFGLFAHDPYRRGSHDVATFAISCAASGGLLLTKDIAFAGVSAVSLRRGSIGAAASMIVTAAPALLLIWLAESLPSVWGVWTLWAEYLPENIVVRASEFLLLIYGLEGMAAVASVAALGVITPVALAERKPILQTVGRTWRLLSGNRWKLLGLFLLVEAAIWLVSTPAALIYVAERRNGTMAFLRPMNWIVSAIELAFRAFWIVVAASAFLELRRVHDGADQEQIAETFA